VGCLDPIFMDEERGIGIGLLKEPSSYHVRMG